MFGLFKSKSLLTEEDKEFQIACFKWLLKNFGGDDFYKDTELVLPTKDFFPTEIQSADDAAIETFNVVKKYAGMGDWPCKLQKQEEDVDAIVAPTVVISNTPASPLGTFQVDDKENIVITYNPAIVNNPTQLVATLAHELAHYLTGCGKEEPPAGWENWEFATDITATFLGFGIFMANSAFHFTQYTNSDSQGWKSSRSGYLSEAEHVFALAVFLHLKGITQDNAQAYLKPYLRKMLNKAMNEVSDFGFVAELANIEC